MKPEVIKNTTGSLEIWCRGAEALLHVKSAVKYRRKMRFNLLIFRILKN